MSNERKPVPGLVAITLPPGLEHATLAVRLRVWAALHAQLPLKFSGLLAALEEAATEVELGQCTPLTYRGNRGDGEPPGLS